MRMLALSIYRRNVYISLEQKLYVNKDMVQNVCRHLIETTRIIQSEFYNNVTVNSVCCLHSRLAFLNRRAEAWYRGLASIIMAARDSPGICHFSFLSTFHE